MLVKRKTIDASAVSWVVLPRRRGLVRPDGCEPPRIAFIKSCAVQVMAVQGSNDTNAAGMGSL